MKEKTHLFIMKYVSNDYELCYNRGCKEYHGTSPSNALLFSHRKSYNSDVGTLRKIRVRNMTKG